MKNDFWVNRELRMHRNLFTEYKMHCSGFISCIFFYKLFYFAIEVSYNLYKQWCVLIKMPKNKLFFLDREIKMTRNTLFLLDREIKMPRNAIFDKNTAKLKWPRKFHAAKVSCNKVISCHLNIMGFFKILNAPEKWIRLQDKLMKYKNYWQLLAF